MLGAASRNLLKYSFRPIQSKNIPRQDAPGATDSIPLIPEHPRNQRLAAPAKRFSTSS